MRRPDRPRLPAGYFPADTCAVYVTAAPAWVAVARAVNRPWSASAAGVTSQRAVNRPPERSPEAAG